MTSRRQDEDGATAVIIAILILALLGIGALVVDVGNLMWERRMLQNSADAGSLSAAQGLAEGIPEADALLTAQEYASENNNRGAHVDPVDGFEVDPADSTVRVTAETGNQLSAGTLTTWLASVLNPDFNETRTQATAVAQWGNMGGGVTLPIAICERNFNHFTTNGTVLPSQPQPHFVRFGTPPGGSAAASHQDCTNPSHDPYPGGFGFLNRDDDCFSESSVEDEDGTWYPGKNGGNANDPNSTCSASDLYQVLRQIIDGNHPMAPDSIVLVPIFDGWRNPPGEFRVIGYGAFKLQGYFFKAPGGDRYGTTVAECGPPRNCLKGHYEEFVALGDKAEFFEDAGDFGVTAVTLTE